ncbi:MAG: dUTP diphosphatase [Peptococcaceae bacterium]|nr:dUTP diphosphatase [Peptococcaceae bacterium]
MEIIKIKRLNPDGRLPEKAHPTDAGYDLFAAEEALIGPGESRMIKTGIAMALPPMTEAQIRPRSGLALKHQITLLNSPGTIDADYRGELGIIVINHGKDPFQVTKGMKIAQMVIARVLPTQICQAESLEDTPRGAGGFGSTGI